ncbi:hypothetical protein SAMN04487916_111118 [Arthrobacter sp. ov407]|uniref:hypothetical protein n=1 Tax=Arthrobacter sp. ov407 TaxID=1761748 RepID=UPI000886CB32|nr:hypothetical protein [Arthrobacter sp. ov407]SDL61890.1 hypothetical protein SAMN04487916_111118 [Arthrobacter sp. ov407]
MTFTLEDTREGVDLVVTGDWSQDARECLLDGRADGLVLNYAKGFHERDLQFVRGLPIRRLNLLARTLTDLSPVYSLGDHLVSLRVQSDPSSVIELERLPLLRGLSADWHQVQGSILFAPHLEQLVLGHYSEADFRPLASLPSLASVVMTAYPRVRSLDGIEDLPWLAELGIHLAKNLEDITALERSSSPVLEILELSSCRKVVDLAPVASCPSLRIFEFSECGDVPTLAPLAGLTRLEQLHLYGTTRVVDGDLHPIAQLPRLEELRMKSRQSYCPSVKEIQQVIAP